MHATPAAQEDCGFIIALPVSLSLSVEKPQALFFGSFPSPVVLLCLVRAESRGLRIRVSFDTANRVRFCFRSVSRSICNHWQVHPNPLNTPEFCYMCNLMSQPNPQRKRCVKSGILHLLRVQNVTADGRSKYLYCFNSQRMVFGNADCTR